MVSLSTEQYQKLLSDIVVLRVRYGERNSSKVEEFISAISTFKLVEKIPDPDVVTGMAMLLEGDTAEWWRGVEANVQSFDDVVRMLRESFTEVDNVTSGPEGGHKRFPFAAPSVVRANCPSKRVNGSSSMVVSFNYMELCVGRNIPVVNVQLFGVPVQQPSAERDTVILIQVQRQVWRVQI
ncbi:hypothetical protein FF38_06723 [Lucilia cuprina]|uniref:Uncharacterized protein n=1 Tax=Lucilia cuprina TaxID=7375 RepID=A0A0L0C4X4_LUCCU|nr:hypothetical protein FF38_06723 [Lucilia cuprina]